MGAVVVEPGSATLVLGREQVLDRASMRMANALLGNPDSAAGLEVLLGGLKLRFVTGSAVAVTGGRGHGETQRQRTAFNKAVRVAPGAVLEFGPALFGLRYYVGGPRRHCGPGRAAASWCGADIWSAARAPFPPRGDAPCPACFGPGTSCGCQSFARASGTELRRRYVASADQRTMDSLAGVGSGRCAFGRQAA